MQESYRNICRIARQTAGLTQERFAEQIDVSVESVRLYEAGEGMPSDDVVTRMIEVAGMPVLGYWHLLNKSRIAADILPELQECSLPQAVIQLICRMVGNRAQRACAAARYRDHQRDQLRHGLHRSHDDVC